MSDKAIFRTRNTIHVSKYRVKDEVIFNGFQTRVTAILVQKDPNGQPCFMYGVRTRSGNLLKVSEGSLYRPLAAKTLPEASLTRINTVNWLWHVGPSLAVVVVYVLVMLGLAFVVLH